jgi:hypothetical protein
MDWPLACKGHRKAQKNPITVLPRLKIEAQLLVLYASTYALVQVLSALLLKILNLNLLNSELIEVP